MSQMTAPTTDVAQIPGLKILEEVGRGTQSIVYRASRGDRCFAVKVPRDTSLLTDSLLQFRREAGVLARAHHTGLAEIVEVGDVAGNPYLVMEYVEGRTLALILEDGPTTEEFAINLAKTLSGALASVHAYGLVHRDIKPQNILVDKNNAAKLIDFGFAGAVDHETGDGAVVGTFLYSPPEQTGVLKRPLDGRTDLYSLGVVLFECVTGTTPFRSKDAAELIRQHAVMAPPDVRELSPEVSPALAGIISKLLGKDPDDRYQTARGLLLDLERIPELNRSIAAAEEIVLDPQNAMSDFVSETPIIGRDTEVAILRNRWNAVTRGTGTVIMVEGEPGSGKTRLIRELIAKTRTPETVILRGKCYQGTPQPLAALKEAIDEHLRSIHALPLPQRKAFEDRIHGAAGEVAPLLKRFSPALADLLKTTADIPELSDAQDLFYYAVADFLLRYTKASGAVMLFIDDIQWMDDATRQVLARVTSQLADTPLMIACAGRNNGPNMTALAKFTAEMGASISTRLRLVPMVEGAIARLVSSHLGGAQVDTGFITQIANRANGNPFAVGEYVRAMLDAGLLRPSWGTWLVDTAGLEKLQIPTDVEELVVKRIEDLGEKTKEILRAAAVIGSRFRIEPLPVVSGTRLTEVNSALAEATMARLVERGDAGEYSFVHNRVKEALLASLGPNDLRAIHQKIAESLDVSGGEGSEYVYSLARHYSLGQVERNPQRVFETNYAAGLKALENYANEDAYGFLKQAYQFAVAARIAVGNSLEETLGNICVQTSRFADAVVHLSSALEGSTDQNQKARLRGKVARIHLANMDLEKAKEEVSRAFSEIGTRAPGNNPLAWVKALWDLLIGVTMDRFVWGVGSAQAAQLDRLNSLAQLYELEALISYHEFQPGLVLQSTFRAIRVVQTLGACREYVIGKMLYALVAGFLGWGRVSDRFSRRAKEAADALGDPVLIGHVAGYNAVRSAFLGRRREFDGLMQALEDFAHTLPFDDVMSLSTHLVWSYLVRGYAGDAQKWAADAQKKVEALGARMGETKAHLGAWVLSFGVGAAILQGNRQESLEKLKAFDQLSLSHRFYLAVHYGALVLFHLEQGELGPPLEEAIRGFKVLGIRPGASPLTLRHFYVFQGYARLAQCNAATGERKTQAVKALKEAVQELKSAASTPVLKSHFFLLKAAVARLEGSYQVALNYLSVTENVAREIDCPLALFEAARQRALLLTAFGNPVGAVREARVAYSFAIECGWAQRARQLKTDFTMEDVGGNLSPSAGVRSTQRKSGPASNLNLQRQLDALVQLSLASGSILNPDRQAKVALDEIVRLLGAERAFIFLQKEETQELIMKAGRDSQGGDIKELKGYSTTVVEEVRAGRKPLVVSGTEEGAVLGSQSAVAHNLRSIMAAPMMIGERLVGVVYLDSRLAKGIFTEDDVKILLALANHIAIALETSRSAQIEMERRALEKDLELAGAVQNLLLPKETVFASDTIRMAAFFQTATQSGGDWWWFDMRPDGTAVALVGDVTGHGAGSAMMTAAISSSYRTMAILGSNEDIPKVFQVMNTNLLKVGSDMYSMTMSAVEINPAKGELSFWNSGAPPIFILKPDGSIETVVERSTPLGTEQFQMGARKVPILKGSRVFVFTDGIYEFTTGGRQYGRKKLQGLFGETKGMSVEDARAKITGEVMKLIGKAALEDDMTFVLIDIV